MPRTPYASGKADSTKGDRSCISGGSVAFGSVKYFTTSGGRLVICAGDFRLIMIKEKTIQSLDSKCRGLKEVLNVVHT